MTLSPSRQRNAVSEGTAFGLFMCDQVVVPFNKLKIDLSFEGAWRSWSLRDLFRQISTDIRNGSDGVWVMTHATETRRTSNFYWEVAGREIFIFARPQWAGEPVDEDVVAESIDGGVSVDGWRKLAEDFLAHFGQ